MQLTSTIFLAATSVLSFSGFVAADSTEFNLMVLRSGSQYHFSSVVTEDGVLNVGGDGDGIAAVITDDGKLKLSDGTYGFVNDDNELVVGTEGSSPFSIIDKDLAYAGSQAFGLNSNGTAIYVGETNEPLSLRVIGEDNVTIEDFSGTSSVSSSSSITVAPTATSAASNISTTSVTPSSIITVQTANGAANIKAGLGLGLAAIGAFLI